MAVADVPATPGVKSSLKQAWENIWPNFWWLLLFGIIAGMAGSIGNSGSSTNGGFDPVDITMMAIGGLASIFLGMPLSMGVTKAHLAASRGEKPTWKDLGYAFGPRYWQTVGLGVLSALIILGGFVLLIFPGIYLAVRLAFTGPRFIEDNLGIRDALKASFEDTKGRFWSVFGLGCMALLLFIAGFVALIVGIFVAMVLVAQMFVVYWRSVRGDGADTSGGANWVPAPATTSGSAPSKAAAPESAETTAKAAAKPARGATKATAKKAAPKKATKAAAKKATKKQ